MSEISFITGFGAHRSLKKAVKDMTDEVKSSMPSPDGIILTIGPYSLSRKELNRELSFLKHDLMDCKMIGTQQQAVFTSDGHKVNYAVKGVGCLAWTGTDLIPQQIKNIRYRSKKKGKEFRRKWNNLPNSEYHLLFPPGIYYPSQILKSLKGLASLNPLSIYNSRLANHPKLFGPIFNFISKMQNLTNIGIPYSSIWEFIDGFRGGEILHNFSGAFGINTDTFKRTFQFINWKSYSKDLIIGSIKKGNLKIGTGFGVGVKDNSKNRLTINNSLSGGLIIDFESKKNKKINKIQANKSLFDKLSIKSDAWYRNTEASLGLSVFHPCYIEPNSKGKNTSNDINQYDLDNYPSLYFLMANKQMQSTMAAAPDQVVSDIRRKKYKAFLGTQSATDIFTSIKESVKGAKINGGLKEIYAGIFIECSNRAQALEEQFSKLLEENIKYVQKPFIGLVTSGEIAPRSLPIVCSSLVTILIGN